jgi:hypothetical protein
VANACNFSNLEDGDWRAMDPEQPTTKHSQDLILQKQSGCNGDDLCLSTQLKEGA